MHIPDCTHNAQMHVGFENKVAHAACAYVRVAIKAKKIWVCLEVWDAGALVVVEHDYVAMQVGNFPAAAPQVSENYLLFAREGRECGCIKFFHYLEGVGDVVLR